ncbi:hypothetical protein T4B_7784 [Trichinella pseudospiralis]|uniref:Uncharacterized protein n=1 Tax=Trichinella pseudospiralis TaxID=6337 RepID=A0A0V1HQX1_TRIPS|nr:hypothetical protein T4A_3164 [Trichinella pseudospiralis]KRZ13118.1 hypothetical protein T4B_7784 [Trichinella pseudospiralis]
MAYNEKEILQQRKSLAYWKANPRRQSTRRVCRSLAKDTCSKLLTKIYLKYLHRVIWIRFFVNDVNDLKASVESIECLSFTTNFSFRKSNK